MKHLFKKTTCLILPMLACNVHANSYMGTGAGEYYFGANLQYIFLKPSQQYQDFFKKQHPGTDLYVGYRFNRTLGFELGYGWTSRVSKETSFTQNQRVFNNLQLDQATDITGKVRYRTTHLDMNGYYPLNQKIDGIVSIGVGFLRPNVRVSLSNPNANLAPEVSAMSCKTNPMMRLGIGVEGMLGDYWGLCSIVRYENTGRTRIRNAGVGGSKIFKDSVSITFGFYRYLD